MLALFVRQGLLTAFGSGSSTTKLTWILTIITPFPNHAFCTMGSLLVTKADMALTSIYSSLPVILFAGGLNTPLKDSIRGIFLLSHTTLLTKKPTVLWTSISKKWMLHLKPKILHLERLHFQEGRRFSWIMYSISPNIPQMKKWKSSIIKVNLNIFSLVFFLSLTPSKYITKR